MKLYYTPLACSLADHIALNEAGAAFERESVDLVTKKTASGADFRAVTPKGYVPALVLDDGEVITENIAILDWLAGEFPVLGQPGRLGRTRVLEALTFISTEIHRAFKPMWHAGSETQKARARATISGLFEEVSGGRRATTCSATGQASPTSTCSSCSCGRAASASSCPSRLPRCAAAWPPVRPCRPPCATRACFH